MTYALNALKNETQAAQLLREQIREIVGEDSDADLVRDTIEGETNLLEFIEDVIMQVSMDSALVDGIKGRQAQLSERRSRLEGRIEAMRVAIMAAMETAEVPKLETPLARLTVKDLPPKALVIEESDIPSDYFILVDPKLDKKAVLDALKAGKTVPGAQLSNGGKTIQIKWS